MAKKMKDSTKIWTIVAVLLFIMLAVLLYNNSQKVYVTNETYNSSNFDGVSGVSFQDIEADGDECSLDFSKNVVCQDEIFVGTLIENDGPTNCYILVDDSGWTPIYTGITNSVGVWSGDVHISTLGSWDFIGVCDRDNDKMWTEGIDCATNIENLVVQDCSFGNQDGDVVGGADGTENFQNDEYIDMDMSGITDGDCKLKARIQYDWDYVDADACHQTGIAGTEIWEGVLFEFDDSDKTVWESLETSPNMGTGDETYCGLVYDGVTPWRFHMSRTNDIGDCEIVVNYDIDIVTCDCGDGYDTVD